MTNRSTDVHGSGCSGPPLCTGGNSFPHKRPKGPGPLKLQGFRALINLIVLHLPLLAPFISDLPTPFIARSQWSPALCCFAGHLPSPAEVTTISYSSQLLQVPAPPTARSLLHLQPGQSAPLQGYPGGSAVRPPPHCRTVPSSPDGQEGPLGASLLPPTPTSGGDAQLAGQCH